MGEVRYIWVGLIMMLALFLVYSIRLVLLTTTDDVDITGEWILLEMKGEEFDCFVPPYNSELYLVSVPHPKLYVTDSLFVFPFVFNDSVGNCSFVHSSYFLSKDSLFLDSKLWGTISWSCDTLVLKLNGCKLLLERKKGDVSNALDISEIHLEVYDYDYNFVDSISFYKRSCDYIGCMDDDNNSSYVNDLFMIIGYIDSASYNRIYGVNTYDTYRYELCFRNTHGVVYQIISNTNSRDIPFELHWLQRHLEKRYNCLLGISR